MQNNIIVEKPLFEYSELELKAIAFDIHETMRIQESNLNLIRSELNRRAHSKVLTTINESDLQNIQK